MSMSSNAVAAVLAQETGEVFLTLAEITHETLQAPLRFVDNTENISHNGETYQAVAFKFTPPTCTGENDTPARLAIDNVDRFIMELIIPLQTPLKINFKVVLASSPDTVEWESGELILRDITTDVQQISGSLFDVYIADRVLPGIYFTPFDFPGLF